MVNMDLLLGKIGPEIDRKSIFFLQLFEKPMKITTDSKGHNAYKGHNV